MASERVDVGALWEEIRAKKPLRQGLFLGEENEKFYVAKSESDVYEMSMLTFYVWLLCNGERTVEELAERISAAVEIDVEDAIELLVLTINSLASAELVEFV